MLKTSSRVLRLLSLLQARREWLGAELGEHLEVDVRTIRRDVDRLRDLGYVVEADAGPGGGYRLGAGSTTPPLLLDEEEALAVAAALSAAAGTVANLQDVALRVLVKLEQLLPTRLRHRLSALQAVTVSMGTPWAVVDPRVLTTLAIACRDGDCVAFHYRDQRDRESDREVEPMRLVHTGRVWYLAAWDLERSDWRTFRVDRIDAAAGLKVKGRFTARTLPEDFATHVSRSIAASPYRYMVRFRVRQPAAAVQQCIPPWVGVVEAAGENDCILTVGGDTCEIVTALVVQAGIDFELIDPPELAEPMRAIARRLLRGADAAGQGLHAS